MAVNRRPDRRTQKTRRQLQNALIELILEKGYHDTTVDEITRLADLGRSTFYLHYNTKEDLLVDIINEMVNGLAGQISQLPLSEWKIRTGLGEEYPRFYTPIRLVFDHASQNARLYQAVLLEQAVSTQRIQEIISREVAGFITVKSQQQDLELRPEVPVEVLSHYLAGAMVGVISWWLENNLPYPPEQMADLFHRMFFLGAIETLGSKPEKI